MVVGYHHFRKHPYINFLFFTQKWLAPNGKWWLAAIPCDCWGGIAPRKGAAKALATLRDWQLDRKHMNECSIHFFLEHSRTMSHTLCLGYSCNRQTKPTWNNAVTSEKGLFEWKKGASWSGRNWNFTIDGFPACHYHCRHQNVQIVRSCAGDPTMTWSCVEWKMTLNYWKNRWSVHVERVNELESSKIKRDSSDSLDEMLPHVCIFGQLGICQRLPWYAAARSPVKRWPFWSLVAWTAWRSNMFAHWLYISIWF